ncbi:MAG: UvrD-helicase domain-containing protein [Crocinitomicaceae bacterium]
MLIVDEYQDVNPVQEALIQELAKSNANLCVVEMMIKRFISGGGGDVRYIQNFAKRYDNVIYIKLEDNFRSTPAVVDAALKCITNNKIDWQK